MTLLYASTIESQLSMRTCSTLILLLGLQFLSAQNIIQNGDFEGFDKWAERQYCQYSDVEYFTFYVNHWNTPSISSPDYFTVHPKRRCNLFPVQPHSGYSYLGLTTYTDRGFHEYINNTLGKPLEKGKTYYLEYWIAPYHKPDKIYAGGQKGRATYFHPSNNLGFYFYKLDDSESLSVHMTPLYDVQPQINMDSILVIPRAKWHRVSYIYKPDDAYTHMVFGNLLSQKNTQLGPCESKPSIAGSITSSREAYYYLDDFFMARAVSDFKDASTFEEVPLEVVNSANLLFDTKSAEISDLHIDQIKQSWNEVKDKRIINISIRGFADNVGSKVLNDSLSAARARNAQRALQSLGAPADIIKIMGFGSAGATADNSTESGREQNRRVEITFNIKGTAQKTNAGLFDKYKANDRSKMIGKPLVVAHNHLDIDYPLKVLMYANGANEPNQIMDIPDADQIVYGLFEEGNQYKVMLINKSGTTYRLDVK